MTENAQPKKRVETLTYTSEQNALDGASLNGVETSDPAHTLERRLELVQEAGKLGIWEWQADKDELWFSDAALDILGVASPIRHIGISFYKDLPIEDDRESADAHFQAALNSVTAEYKDEFRVRHAN